MNKDQSFFANIYDQHADEIYRYIFLLTKNAAQSEDLLQDTYIKVWQNIEKAKEVDNIRAWIFKIAYNASMDYLRKRKPLQLVEALWKNEQDSDPIPEHYVQLKERSRELYESLNRMKESHRKVIILRKIHEFTVKETADILNWSESKVKTTLLRALKSLEKKLMEDGGFYEEEQSGI